MLLTPISNKICAPTPYSLNSISLEGLLLLIFFKLLDITFWFVSLIKIKTPKPISLIFLKPLVMRFSLEDSIPTKS